MHHNILKAARAMRHNTQFEMLSRFGYITNGALHVLIGIAVITLSFGQSQEADQSGVLLPLSRSWYGTILLILITLGLSSLGIWQIVRVIVMRKAPGAERKWPRQLSELGKGVAYLVLGLSSLTYIFASATSQSNVKETQRFALNVISLPGGTVLLFIVGLIISAIGAYFTYRGLTKEFVKSIDIAKIKLKKTTLWLGIYGYCAKGLTILIVGILFCQAALTLNVSKASGLDGAFVELLSLPLGIVLTVILGVGFIVYAAYSVVRGRYGKL